ncbi:MULTISPECIES: DUF6036 family nucleotidyltransferase [Bacillaceae]|uniref:DUF6036 family nucleotidyltransferase n=1 Tax=Bacillaceae TaxID=186817 RepID=UPI000E747227|nr:DUF6036 family nucleotidyltransferase [Bacillus sp. PK3_68]RJS50099.1 hypothetical protein CJ483_22635 [Bacillus sp. PK3_68]
MNIRQAQIEINKLKSAGKYEAMLKTAAILTKLLAERNVKPIIVGGLSVTIYTQNDYTTRDIDMVSEGYETIANILGQLDFKKDGRHFYNDNIEIAIEIPGSYLEGDYSKVKKIFIDDENYVYLISIEDIILDRLRAAVHWKSLEDREWGFKLLASNFDSLDKQYLFEHCQTQKEVNELDDWFTFIAEQS